MKRNLLILILTTIGTLSLPLFGCAQVPAGTPGQATLAWNASPDTVAGYNVYRALTANGSFSKLNSSPVTTLSFVDSIVTRQTTYFWCVTAQTATGLESPCSNVVSATIPKGVAPPVTLTITIP